MGQYILGDAVDELEAVDPNTAAVIHLDDAWDRPQRNDEYSGQRNFGVNYPTHGFETTTTIIDACHRVLKPGGWLIADADDYLLPRLITYLRKSWGDVAATYSGGGFRRAGGVTLTTVDGEPDRSTPGMYLTNGGYHVVFAHKGETQRRSAESARQIAERPCEYGWSGVKPLSPYRTWIEALTDPGEFVVIPCAGTAPAAIAAAQLDREWLAIDCEPAAKNAFQERLADARPWTTQVELP